MIAGIFHKGSGLGNQLHRYVATRVLALDKGFEFGMLYSDEFKGSSFLNLNYDIRLYLPQTIPSYFHYFEEKKITQNDVDVRGYDPEINFVQDNTVIEGEFQDERYFIHRLPEIREWLKVEPLETNDNLCVINFRGGEFSVFPDLFLTKEYWHEAIRIIKDKYRVTFDGGSAEIAFEVHTDDPITAKQFFPDYPIIQDIGLNWRSIRYAKHLILSNSSFAILPALLNENVQEVIAPRYWARRNIKVWALPQNYYKKFTYI